MANALVIHKDRFPQSQRDRRAAQYVRMSTDFQQYSIENQAVVIAAYAQMHNLAIVRTYRDEGESGLTIKNRTGLTRLVNDVQSGSADFGTILVLDVSRWGRFQDVDESAHYEFICKQGGIKVAYCAEQFQNDGSLISQILKNIKRVMAAEYSRELSAKVYAGQSRYAKLGFKMGGRVPYGLERVVVNEHNQPKGVLKAGERKYLTTEHVRLRPGSPDETATVKWIFDEFVRGITEKRIARELNLRGVPTNRGARWRRGFVTDILRNEVYIGTIIYNRVGQKLGSKKQKNPESLWIKTEGCVEPIIRRDVFMRVRTMMKERRVDISEDEMLARLRRVLMKQGQLSMPVIDKTVGLPCSRTYLKHFGSLQNVYRLLGYTGSRWWHAMEIHKHWSALNAGNAELLRERFQKLGYTATFDPAVECLRVRGVGNICFRLARWLPYYGNHSWRWAVRRRVKSPAGLVVLTRLGEHNKEVLDYLLLPSTSFRRVWLTFSDRTRGVHKIESFASFADLSRSVVRRMRRSRPGA